MAGLVQSLIETVIGEAAGEAVLPAVDHRMVYIVEGEVTVTDRRDIRRLGENSGTYVQGEVTLHAEVPSRIWTFQLSPDAADPAAYAGSHVRLERPLDDIAVPGRYVMRLDRVDFPPGAVAHTHTHTGPGIRVVKTGAIEIQEHGTSHHYRAGEAWFERGPDPVRAPTTEAEPTAFIRCMVATPEWRGRSTIAYVDPADADLPKLQRYFRFIDTLIEV
ncbi:hypothetical protein [Amorphus coralli]|uniref:hypothetical protein n=1 Tax=Amorphus coralli TaxID=340680 RepID=UPI0003745995|nr:hypothetical protein [Amorphus coralli]